MIGVGLNSRSDSWVPTHGATSVPSMLAFKVICVVAAVDHRSFDRSLFVVDQDGTPA